MPKLSPKTMIYNYLIVFSFPVTLHESLHIIICYLILYAKKYPPPPKKKKKKKSIKKNGKKFHKNKISEDTDVHTSLQFFY